MQSVYRTKLDRGRRIAIPAEVCQKLGIHQGDPVTIEIRDDGLHLIPYAQVIRRLQAAFAPYKTPGVNEVEELMRERREEAARENDE